ncbi:adenosine receptor A3-like [Montipora foliosa]|uniref:adenosine receptor A3-like n=1 Tax=Montipora foliosa TaxID=591990 RepID=UPI0035F109CB
MADDSSNKQNETIHEEQLAQFSPSECIGWFAVLCSLGVATVTINALLIIVYLKEPSLRKRSMYLVISLAVADMCVGGISLSIEIFNSGVSCSSRTSIIRTRRDLIINLAVISLERMHATFRPLEHRLIRKWIFGASVAVVWFTAILSSAYVYLDIRFTLSGPGEFYSYLSILAFCFFTIVVSYTSIVVKMYFGTRPQRHGAVSRERKLTKTLFIVTVVSSVLLLPYILSHFLIFSKRPFYAYSSQTIHLRFLLVSLAYANSLVNPILYAYRIPEFERAMSSVLGCRPRAQVFPQSDS